MVQGWQILVLYSAYLMLVGTKFCIFGPITGFYLAQKFKGGNMGEVEVISRLGSPRGWVREGPSMRSAGS